MAFEHWQFDTYAVCAVHEGGGSDEGWSVWAFGFVCQKRTVRDFVVCRAVTSHMRHYVLFSGCDRHPLCRIVNSSSSALLYIVWWTPKIHHVIFGAYPTRYHTHRRTLNVRYIVRNLRYRPAIHAVQLRNVLAVSVCWEIYCSVDNFSRITLCEINN